MMGTSIVTLRIFPGLNDDWVNSPPFIGQPLNGTTHQGFILATDTDVDAGFDDFRLVTGYLYAVSKIHNAIDFLQKTRTQTQDRNKSSGVGGYAKLKDFTFTIDATDVDVRALYGREIQVGIYHQELINSPTSPAEYESFYRGAVQKIKQTSDGKLRISVQGISSVNNPRISGTPIINSDGTQVFNTVIIGSGNGFIKLNKTKELGGVQLSFDDKKFELQDIYVKGTSSDDLFLITSPWTVIDGKIFFSGDGHAWLQNQPTINETETEILVNDPSQWFVRLLNTDLVNHPQQIVVTVTDYFPPENPVPINVTFSRSIIDSELDGKPIAIYTCHQGPTHPDYINFFESAETVFDGNNNSIQFQVDLFKHKAGPFLYQPWYADVNYPIDASSQAGTISKWWPQFSNNHIINLSHRGRDIDAHRGETFLNPGISRQLVIQINDEKMLVLDSETVWDFPFNRRKLKVVRGYQDTTPAVHSRFDDIIALSTESNQVITIEHRTECSGFKFLTNHVTSAQDIQEYFDTASVDNEILTLDVTNSGRSQNINNGNLDTDLNRIPVTMEFLFPDFSATIRSAIFKANFVIDVDVNLGDLVGGNTFSFTRITMMVSSTDQGPNGSFPFPEGNTTAGNNTAEAEKHRRGTYGYNLLDPNALFWSKVPDEVTNQDIANSASATDPLSELADTHAFLAERRVTKNATTGLLLSDRSQEIAAHAMVGAWSPLTGTIFDHPFRRESFTSTYNLETLTEYTESDFALGLIGNQYASNGKPGFWSVHMTKPYFDMRLDIPLKDNEFWGKVKTSDGNGTGTIVSTFAIGPNATIFLDKTNKYLFAESDTIPLIVFRVTASGLLVQLSVATLVTYPDLGGGTLVRQTVNGKITKINLNQVTQVYDYLEIQDPPNYPAIDPVQKGDVSLLFNTIGSKSETDGLFIIQIVGIEIQVLKVNQTNPGNPANLLYELFTDQAEIPVNRVDKTSFDALAVLKVQHDATVLLEEEVNVNTIIDRLAKEHGILCFEGNDGLIKATDLVPPDPSTINIELTDSVIFFNDKKLPDVKIQFTDMDFLITDLEARYEPFGNIFQKQLFATDLTLLTTKFQLAIDATNDNEVKVALELLSVFDENVARVCAEVKMFYHFTPSRIITIKCILATNSLELGTWITLDTTAVPESSGKVYLVIGNNISLPYRKADFYVELVLYEYDSVRSNNVYQETPSIPVNENYQEVPDNSNDGFQEEPGTSR